MSLEVLQNVKRAMKLQIGCCLLASFFPRNNKLYCIIQLQTQATQNEDGELFSREVPWDCDDVLASSVSLSPDDTGVYSEIPGEYMPLTILTRSWEVSREKFTIQKVIGKGAFGQVAKAIATDIHGISGPSTVAVKMLKGTLFMFSSLIIDGTFFLCQTNKHPER